MKRTIATVLWWIGSTLRDALAIAVMATLFLLWSLLWSPFRAIGAARRWVSIHAHFKGSAVAYEAARERQAWRDT